MKVRIAVNPAAPLHVGSARTALLNWLLARCHRAHLLLRHDDLEAPDPTTPAAPAQDLRWLGLDWDAEIRQSERRPLYAAAIERLRAANRLYPCFESEEELNSKREARQRRSESTIYDRAMLKLTPEQRARAEAGGKRPYWRFLLSGIPAEWGDMVLGRQEVKLSAVSDPILVRADGTPLPALCSAVDDLDAGTTHVVRSQDHMEGTGIQIDPHGRPRRVHAARPSAGPLRAPAALAGHQGRPPAAARCGAQPAPPPRRRHRAFGARRHPRAPRHPYPARARHPRRDGAGLRPHGRRPYLPAVRPAPPAQDEPPRPAVAGVRRRAVPPATGRHPRLLAGRAGLARPAARSPRLVGGRDRHHHPTPGGRRPRPCCSTPRRRCRPNPGTAAPGTAGPPPWPASPAAPARP